MTSSVKIKKMLSKLRQPLGINYISKNLLNVNESEARDILNELVEEGILMEENNEYKIKSNKK